MKNMGKTYILGNSETLKELSGTFIEIPLLNTNEDSKLHDWLVTVFKNNEIDKIVIEIGKNPIIALQIGYHIRLSIEDLKRKTLVPILFVSRLPLYTIMLQSELYSQILATNGTYFSEIEKEAIEAEIEHATMLSESDYLMKFLKIIHIQPDETIGRHSLANIWGAYTMDKATNVNILDQYSAFKKNLYFKYVSAFNNMHKLSPSSLNVIRNINVGSANTINSENKRILLIDDEADQGWEKVLRKVFKTSNPDDFMVIKEKVKDFDSFSKENKCIIETQNFDLYLVDLRLNGLEEDENNITKEFSGTKVLQKIKSLNKGYQVIIFTASNKVWNLKSLLDEGADGYYMKVSPEYNFSRKVSEQNYIGFKENVEKCFERGYLKPIFTEKKNLISILSAKTNYNSDFLEALKSQLNLSYHLLSKAESKEQFAYAYISLYMIIEFVNNEFYTRTANDKWKIVDSGNLLDWKWDQNTNAYSNTGAEVAGNKPPEWQKLAGIYYQKWGKNDHSLIQKIYFLITKRNGFIHNDSTILDKKDTKGNFVNHDIFESHGFIKLFEAVKKILGFI